MEGIGDRSVGLALLGATAALLIAMGGAGEAASAASQVHAARCGSGTKRVHGRCVPIFQAPRRKARTGLSAWRVVGPWFLNSTFTDCPAKWPRCAVEHRYGHTRGGLFYFCRLTSVSGADIINSGFRFQVIGVSLSSNGSWGLTFRAEDYSGVLQYYTWRVSNRGLASGLRWSGGSAPGVGAATGSTGTLRWVRGARTCSW